jgi:HupE / UreJ protein
MKRRSLFERRLILLPLALVASAPLHSHLQPTTLVLLDVRATTVDMKLHIPLPELELAFGHDVARQPEQTVSLWGAPLRQYLLEHLHPVTTGGEPWAVQVRNLTVGHAEQTQSGPFQEVTVALTLTPPVGASLRDFVLRYDVIMHQVVTHKALVSVESDWGAGRFEPVALGTILVDTGTTRIAPLEIHLGAGNSWRGFRSMVLLGMRHIREGTDHLLFLIVLLLPATLTARDGRWGGYGGGRYSFLRVVRIVTAFTLGHSATLLAGALRWLRLPQQPVEVLIAVSILVTAIHAVRPVFPGREQQVAAGFGLVHGLAFALVLSDLHLSAGPLALSILGFNLGIELMQLFVIALTMPWFVLISQTAAHPCVRIGGAIFAILASAGWIFNRVSGVSNVIERSMNTVTELAPLGILVLAAVAIPAYLYTMIRGSSAQLGEGEISQ